MPFIDGRLSVPQPGQPSGSRAPTLRAGRITISLSAITKSAALKILEIWRMARAH